MSGGELYELVKDWPKEAKPVGLTFGDDSRWWLQKDRLSAGWPTFEDVAIVMHEASGLRYLTHAHLWPTKIVPPELNDGKNEWAIVWPEEWADAKRGVATIFGTGPTLLHAISAAISALKKDSQ